MRFYEENQKPTKKKVSSDCTNTYRYGHMGNPVHPLGFI